ncbi:MAG TPA: LuxR C-terminal-related transcriptional regulator [Thermomicrobiales bacterium]|nr:LuxR C-terminal-related transcriptional regulator [Thermomicrobiales bacterium]
MASRLLSVQDERVFAEVKRACHAGLDGPALLHRTASVVGQAVPCEGVFASTVDPASNLMTRAIVERPVGQERWVRQAVNRYIDEVYVEFALPSTVRMLRERRLVSTLTELTEGKIETYPGYREILRPLGLRHELYALFIDRDLWGRIGLIRAAGDADYSPRELALVRRLAPHVGTGLRAAALRQRAEVPLDDAVGGDTPGVLTLDHANRVVAITPPAERWLGELGPLERGWRSGDDLPIAVRTIAAALGRALRPVAEADRDLAPRLRVRGRSGGWLTLYGALTEPAEGRASERVIVIAPSRPEEIVWLSAAAYGLSPREEEVVKLVLRGCPTREIAKTLFIAEHTVQRHLSNAFEKVGVRSRSALVKRLFVDHLLPNVGG